MATRYTEESTVSWGKILAGAAIAAGAVAVFAFFPEQVSKVGEVAKSALGGLWSGLGTVGEWIGERIAHMAETVAENKTLAIGSAAAAGALIAMRHPNPDLRESHAQEEMLRRAEARLKGQMQEQGYDPSAGLAR